MGSRQRCILITIAIEKYMEIVFRVVQFIRVLLIGFMSLEVLHDNQSPVWLYPFRLNE